VINNIQATRRSANPCPLPTNHRTKDRCGTHQRMLVGTRIEEHGGKLRDNQNWIGDSSYNPC
jgi:hypothetical protein